MSNNLHTSKDKNLSPDDDFDVFFPKFILALRDFSLQLETNDGQKITPDQYLENALDIKRGKGEETKRFNETKYFLRKYFKKRKCFAFYPPGMPDVLQNMENLGDDDLEKRFVASTHMFLDYVYNECDPLTLMTGIPVNGRMFACQVKYYVDAIRDGDVPNIQSAIESMAIIENKRAVKESIQAYITQMNGELSVQPLDEKTFQDVNIQCKKIAFDVFLKQSVMDKEDKYKEEADFAIGKEYSKFVKRNHEESRKRCNAALNDLHSAIEGKLRLGTYAVAGGYTIYVADREELKGKYDAKTNLGVEKDNMFVEFTEGAKNEKESVLSADIRMTTIEKEKEMERNVKEQLKERLKEQERILVQKREDEKYEHDKKEKQLQEELGKIKEQSERDNAIAQKRLDDLNDHRENECQRREQEGMFIQLGRAFDVGAGNVKNCLIWAGESFANSGSSVKETITSSVFSWFLKTPK